MRPAVATATDQVPKSIWNQGEPDREKAGLLRHFTGGTTMKLKETLVGIIAGAALLTSGLAQAAEWKPSGTLKIQIGFGAGGSTDTLGRIIAATVKEQTGWNVIAENKPGGGGVAMFTGIAKAPADGSVVGIGVNMPIMINLVLRGDKLNFNLDSFDYLGTVARAQLALIAGGDATFSDIASLVEYSKANGGAAIAFDAKPQELIMKNIDMATGAGFKMVSTKSSAEMLKLILGGQVVAGFSAGSHQPYLEKGDIKMLASANAVRHNYAPEIATVREQGYDVYVDPFFFFGAPAGLSDDAKEGLTQALANAINSDKVRDVVKKTLSTEVNNLGPEGTKTMLMDGMANVKVLFAK
jgi:tripartite-type tricarboxylate transporter receptor subunit TctC